MISRFAWLPLLGLLAGFPLPSAHGAEAIPSIPYLRELLQQAEARSLSTEPQWLKLGHYEKGLFGGYVSEVVGSGFFLAPQGAKDPQAELRATLEGFFAREERSYEPLYGDKPERMHPRCQFPARYRWLQARLGIDESRLPPADCARFEKFRKAVAAKSVSLVFSSYALNSPSSAFGHTLLRLNKNAPGEGQRNELLDFGINFAAEVTTDNSLVYAVYGVAGLFRGTYSNVPYYFKVREYNDFETRDLWTYDLNLDPSEMEMLVAHLWELGGTYFRYLYFSQNCSYQVLTAIEAAAPRFAITDRLKPYVIPADTVKEIMAVPGLVAQVSYRPSSRAQFEKRLQALSVEETRALRALVLERPEALERADARPDPALGEDARIRVLDAALDYMDFAFAGDLVKADSPASAWKQKLLFARAEIPKPTEPLKLESPFSESPHLGHGSARVGVDHGTLSSMGRFTQARLRLSLHDMLDPALGYPAYSQVEFGNFRARYYWEKKRLELEELTLFKIMALSPATEFKKGMTWRVHVGSERFRDRNCDRCYGFVFEGGAGYAAEPIPGVPVAAFALLEGGTSYSPRFLAGKWRLGAGPAAGLVLGKGVLKAMVKGGYRYQLFSDYAESLLLESELRWAPNDVFALGARAQAWNPALDQREATLGVSYYY